MEIDRNYPQPLTTLDRKSDGHTRRTLAVDTLAATPQKQRADRRYQPDRRRRQEAFSGPDRRKRRMRRSPTLLNAKTGEGESLENRRGRLLNIKA